MTQTIKEDVKAIKVLQFAIIAGTALFAITTLSMKITVGANGFLGAPNDELVTNVLTILNLVAIGGVSGAILLFKKKMKGIESHEIKKKLEIYRSSTLLRAALLESIAFCFLVCFMLYGSNIFLLESLGILAFLIFVFPTNERIAKDIQHDIQEFQ